MTQNLQFLAKNPKVPNFIPAIVMNDKLQELVCDSWSIHSWQIPIYDCSNHLLLLKSILGKSISKLLIIPLFSFSADLQYNSPQFSNAITESSIKQGSVLVVHNHQLSSQATTAFSINTETSHHFCCQIYPCDVSNTIS